MKRTTLVPFTDGMWVRQYTKFKRCGACGIACHDRRYNSERCAKCCKVHDPSQACKFVRRKAKLSALFEDRVQLSHNLFLEISETTEELAVVDENAAVLASDANTGFNGDRVELVASDTSTVKPSGVEEYLQGKLDLHQLAQPLLRLVKVDNNGGLTRALLRIGGGTPQKYIASSAMLANAAVRGRIGATQALLDHNVDPNTACQGKPPLYYAIRSSKKAEDTLVRILLAAGSDWRASFHRPSGEPVTMMEFAAMEGKHAALRAMLEKELEAASKADEAYSKEVAVNHEMVLMRAITSNQPMCLDLVLRHGWFPDSGILQHGLNMADLYSMIQDIGTDHKWRRRRQQCLNKLRVMVAKVPAQSEVGIAITQRTQSDVSTAQPTQSNAKGG